MRRKKIAAAMGVGMLLSMLLTGCASGGSASAEKIEELDNMGEITVITREEGSGTRGVFAEKTDLVSDETSSSQADKITADAQVAMNAETVIEAVAADENAIGYVSLGSVSAETMGIKVIGVNGVVPEGDTIKDNSYPLTRNFNIAYSGAITDVGNDFLTYILSAGQEIVAEDYTSVKQVSDFLSDQSKGTLTVSGSSSAAPLLEQLAEDYGKYNGNAEISVLTTDSTSGLTAAMQGSSNWGMASRELKDYEQELLTYETIAKDGVAVIVNENSPVENLSVNQLTQIFDGTDKTWIEVND